MVCGSASPGSSMRRSASPFSTPSMRPLNRFRPSTSSFNSSFASCPIRSLEIRRPHQRAVDPRRRNLQTITARHRVAGFQQRRDFAADGCAIVDRHLPFRTFRHDLHGAAVAAGDLDAHKAKTQFLDGGLGEIGDLTGNARLSREAAICVRIPARHRLSATTSAKAMEKAERLTKRSGRSAHS